MWPLIICPIVELSLGRGLTLSWSWKCVIIVCSTRVTWKFLETFTPVAHVASTYEYLFFIFIRTTYIPLSLAVETRVSIFEWLSCCPTWNDWRIMQNQDLWKRVLSEEAETWLFDVFLKTANDGKVGFSENGFVFKLFQFWHIQ